MLSSMTRRLAILVAVVLAAAGLGQTAAAPTRLELLPESAVWLVGDSTLHPFTSRTETMSLTADVVPPTSESDGRYTAILQRKALQKLQLVIPVTSLKSKESGLDRNLYIDLKADTHPEIIFTLREYEVMRSTASAWAYQITCKGMLQIVGVERPVELHADAVADAANLRLQGAYQLLMTDYDVKPRTMMLGAVKVKDKVVVHFDLHLR